MNVSAWTLLAIAREWLGTPWHHQGALKGVGCDCAGLVMGVAREAGIVDVAVSGYPRLPRGHELESYCDAHMQRVPREAMRPGDVGAFRYGGDPQHLAIIGEQGGRLTMIHAHAPARKVVEVALAEPWCSRLAIVYRIPGVVGDG